jgi:hypothetical protein
MELGIYSFADVQRDPNSGALGSTADAMRNLREAIALADAVGLDYFGVGPCPQRPASHTCGVRTKNFHWHMSGPLFRDYHLLLDDHADQIVAMTDEIAEHVRKIGGTTIRSIGEPPAHRTWPLPTVSRSGEV